VAVATFLTGGFAKRDASDVRVVASGRVIPTKIVWRGVDDLCKIAFPLQSGVTAYDIYYGNPGASSLDSQWEPKRGLLLETRRYNGGECASWSQMQDIVKRSGPGLGAEFVPKIFDGFNRFGPPDNYVSIYRGWLNCRASGTYRFATTSDDASFVFIDGKLVVQWPGWHGPRGDARYQSRVSLDRGLHRIEYYHVERTQTQAAVAAWQPPGARTFAVIPGSAFPRVIRVRLRGYELLGENVAPDFDVQNAGESQIGASSLVRMAFENRTAGEGISTDKCSWQFGDGTRGAGQKAEHVYLKPGVYSVTLTLAGRKKRSVTHRISVERAWALQSVRRPDALASYYGIIRAYGFQNLATDHLLVALDLFERLGKMADLARVGDVFLTRDDGITESVLCEQAIRIGKAHRDHGGNYRRAIEVFVGAREGVSSSVLKAKLAFEIGDVYFYFLGQFSKALAEYGKIVLKYEGLEDHVVRLAQIRIGDVYRKKGEYDRALTIYKKANLLKRRQIPLRKQFVRIGAVSRAVEDYLRRNELDAAYENLCTWQWEYPEEKLRGQWSILNAKLAIKKEQYEEAIKQVVVLVRVNPRSTFAPEGLLLAANCWIELNKPREAGKALKQLVDDYPESPLSQDAKGKLEELKE